MNRIENAFKNKPIFMPYFPLGYPDLDKVIKEKTPKLSPESLCESGAIYETVSTRISFRIAKTSSSELICLVRTWAAFSRTRSAESFAISCLMD